MKLSDGELHERLDDRAGAAAGLDLGALARAATSGRRRTGVPAASVVGGLSAAATIVLALAIGGSVIVRTQSTPSPSADASAVVAPTGSIAALPRSPRAWTELVWSLGDPAPFDLPGSTVVADGIADGDGFIAVGSTSFHNRTEGSLTSTGRIWRSPDGVSWSLVEGDWLNDVVLTRILRMDDQFLLVGYHRPKAIGDSVAVMRNTIVWSSDDGTSWERRTPQGAELVWTEHATAGPSGALLAGSEATPARPRSFLVADAELRWRTVPSPLADDARLFGLATASHGWIATGASGAGDATTLPRGGTVGSIWTSSDGATWLPSTVDRPGGVIQGAMPIGGGYLAFGDDTGLPCDGCLGGPFRIRRDMPTWFSTDGRTWGRQATLNSGPGIQTSYGVVVSGPAVASNEERALVIGSTDDGTMAIRETTDGVSWRDLAVYYVVAMGETAAIDLQAIRGPVIVGRTGIVAFHDVPKASVMIPVPAIALADPGPPGPVATFPPAPTPRNLDLACPNELPCDDSNRP